jgi:hypothetical protein
MGWALRSLILAVAVALLGATPAGAASLAGQADDGTAERLFVRETDSGV